MPFPAPRRWLHWLVLFPLLSAGCNATSLARSYRAAGWFRIEPGPGISYSKSFTPVPLGIHAPPCDWLTRGVVGHDRPIYVFVHGIPGDYEEWYDVPPLLARTHPAAMFMFRWVPYEERDSIVEQLAAGMSRLTECFAGHAHPIIVLAHSAGGIIASYAASLITVPTGAPLPFVDVITIAAPLAGVLGRPGSEDGTSAGPFVMEMGTSYTPYSRPAYGIQVVHLRTTYPADVHMKPDRGHLPNDPSIGVIGARQIDLPAGITHDRSILFVAKQIADGSWERWFPEP